MARVAGRLGDKAKVVPGSKIGDNFVLKRAVVDMEAAWQYQTVVEIEEERRIDREWASSFCTP